MMEMDSRDNVKCQKSKLRDMIDIIEILNNNRTKECIVSSLTFKKERKT